MSTVIDIEGVWAYFHAQRTTTIDLENTMKAIAQDVYGSPHVLTLEEIEKPAVPDASLGGSRKVVVFVASTNHEDLVVLQKLLEAGKVTPVVGRKYPLSEAPEAIRYLEAGHARGKVVITV